MESSPCGQKSKENKLTVKENKDPVNFLTLLIENYPEVLKEEGILTVSEESLKGNGLHGKNHEYLLSSPELIEVLSKNYKDEYGVAIKVFFLFLLQGC